MRFTTLAVAMIATALTTLPSAVSSAAVSTGASACSDITLSPSASILTPTSDATAYTAAQNGGFNPLNNKLAPSCIVQPLTTSDVSTVMKAIYRNKANYAVRAGGHTGMAGWDSVQGGVLIDFSKMTRFSYDEKRGTVSVEPGLRWGQIYEKAEEFGVCPMGGRVEHVGTGLILGGGLSLLSPQYGYACDGLISADVVMVDGKVNKVDGASDPRLFRAIKGGGGRFGIVTKYELKAFPTGHKSDKLWYGGSITTLTPAGMDQLIQATEKFTASPDDPKATLLTNVGMLKTAGAPLWLGNAYLFYKGNQAQFESTFKDLLSIPDLIVDTKPMSYLDAAATTPLGWKPTQAYKWMGGSLYPNTPSTTSPIPSLPLIPSNDLPTSWLSTWSNVKTFITKHIDVIESGFWSLTPVRTNQIEMGYSAGGNAISPPRGNNYVHWLFSQILADGTTSFPEDFEKDRQTFLAANPSSAGLPLFLNEVDADQKTFPTYGWYQDLKKEYKRVDPRGFAVQHQVGPTF
ncbi:uncharacterized protein UTRI_05345_B [Ustilago trichophora]|uniref:FAD-binding PCMH-type domain-containing protein n=1 Tax=Ustilago trichophora TaxID=86804 RepID=A0A5C3EMS0_9BASI|nr:uncharacterized protein UTRI_05345_B [Ustilago trichophora]